MMDMKATDEELQRIQEVVANADGQTLDTPEEFLWRIAQFSNSAERIACIVFQADFEERCTSIARRVHVVTHLCRHLLESPSLRQVFSIILTLGNYMNGGNHQRGQADGFGLEILGKLKDVKSNDARVTLLHFIVKTYIAQCRQQNALTSEIDLPVPDPADVNQALTIDFQEVHQQLTELRAALAEAERTSDVVVQNASEATLQPFKDLMAAFLEEANGRIERQAKRLEEAQTIFVKTLRFYKYLPKSGGAIEDCTPAQFFEQWAQFSTDFRDIWKKEKTLSYNE